MTDLPALVIVFPIFASIAVLLVGLVRPRTGWPIATLASIVQIAITGSLALRGFNGDPVQYVVGGFTVPYGIELVIDGLSATMIVLVAVVALGVLGYARTAGPRSNSFYATYLLLVAGLTGMSITGDVFNMYVFLEITGLTAYALVASGKGGRSALAALKYLLVGTFGASLFLLGIGYAYVATGTLNMADLSGQLAAVGYTSSLVQAAFGLLVVGLFVKIAVFPLHTWQPVAYAGAPDAVSGLISALVSTVSAYALIRIVFSVFTVDFLLANPFARTVLMAGAVVSIVTGSLLAVAQSEIKQLLAYSSVSQFGLIIGAIAVGNDTALTGAAIHLVGHAIMKGGLFLTAGLIGTNAGSRTVTEFEGLGKHLPIGAGSFGIIALAMVGVPPTIGFVGKWYIALGAVETQSWPLAAVILLSTLLTLAYFARLIERMYFREPAVTTSSVETTDATDAVNVATDGTGTTPSMGMWMTVVTAAVLSVVLGVVAFEYGQLLEPTIEHLLS
ncbi:monovalent cation/H+ antiporter subunit D family protein [Halocatena pleomorpha]|uniref:Monovalent cation/H+ antiporter subunit D family protein n=1 Tax=Halocatena pleomorpha TaxID=1785090 RepID=A0A3P3RGE8_9EURY|nr:monovalent cation/H+ antiporter subunit D family protein [Halocatena pleomorpha]RRJ31998.1 monovalent cation/H+ antiporter subunit D family protein [Halocatena pleomorpha]